PDVWIPFNDSLDMITGFAPGYKKITVGDDVITMPSDKVVNFKRASGATYINKAGVLAIADVDEPRFERYGLLIEGQRTNNFSNSNSPDKWNRNLNRLDVSANFTDEFGITSAKFTYKESQDTVPITAISTGVSRVVDVANGEYGTISIRARIGEEYSSPVRLRLRFSKLNPDGQGNTFITDVMLDLVTLDVTGGDKLTYDVKRESGGWVLFQGTYKAQEDIKMYARVEMIAREGQDITAGQFMTLATAQVENGSSASSLIVTGDTPVTRASDMVTVPVKLNWSTPAISCLVEVNTLWNLGYMPNLSGAARILDITTKGDSTDIIGQSYMYLGFTSRGSAAVVTNGHTNYTTEYRSILARSKRHNIVGFLFSEDRRLQVVVNGVLGALTTSEHQNQKYTGGFITIGGVSSSGSRHLFGHVRNLRIWHRELTAAQQGEKI
ncbi:TPA: phage tail protein, partial [Escherichia coli]|nr:phage tail protein [Escherichia coli]